MLIYTSKSYSWAAGIPHYTQGSYPGPRRMSYFVWPTFPFLQAYTCDWRKEERGLMWLQSGYKHLRAGAGATWLHQLGRKSSVSNFWFMQFSLVSIFQLVFKQKHQCDQWKHFQRWRFCLTRVLIIVAQALNSLSLSPVQRWQLWVTPSFQCHF